MSSTTRQFAAKDIIFREGDVGDAAYVIQSGKIEILKHGAHGEIQLAILEPGQVFGELALFEPKNVRSATARALEEATLDAISEADFKAMINSCPPHVLPIITGIVSRLRETNRRLAEKERATVILDQGIEKLTLQPASDATKFQPVEVLSARLPFIIGGYPQHEEAPAAQDLEIPCEGPPLMISQKHCQIERQEDGIFLVDMGSRFCTLVNGKPIGRGKMSNKAPLQLGENRVTLGDYTSPYKLTILCE